MSTALQTDDRAFESLYRLHRPLVYAYAFSTLRHVADAEDATQTTFLNAYCALNRGVYPRDTVQWLVAIARNVCRDRFREAKRRPKEEPLGDWERAAQPEEPEFSVDEVTRQLSGLNPRHRKILVMREFEGRSYAEISTELGVSEPAVQALLRRARRSLRDELELGMTCAQTRRVVVRDLNGVALLDERRALQKHLRRCPECASFVGRRRPMTVGRMVWLVTLPYRRLFAIITGSSTVPAGSTAGGAGALAIKMAALGAVGTAAVGVSATELANESSHPVPTPATRPAPSPGIHSTGAARPYSATTFTFRTPAAQSALGRGNQQAAHTGTASATGSTSQTDGPTIYFTSVPSTPGEAAAPTTPATNAPPQNNPAATVPAPDPGSGSAAPAAPSSSDAAAPDASSSTPAQPDASASAAPTTAPAVSPATTPPPAPDVTPPTSTPPTTTPPSPPTQASGHGNGVGPGGTPPAHAGGKPDAPPGKP